MHIPKEAFAEVPGVGTLVSTLLGVLPIHMPELLVSPTQNRSPRSFERRQEDEGRLDWVQGTQVT